MEKEKVKFLQPLDDDQKAAVIASQKVKRWLDRIDAEFDVKEVVFERVHMFGSKVGMVFALATAQTWDGQKVPGITLIRGDSVAILPILRGPDGSDYTVIVKQARLPIGETSFEEIPAGMIDEGVFISKALEELSEEVGADLGILANDLVPLELIYPSPGGCDEALQIYYAVKPLSDEVIKSLQGRRTGAAGEHEDIRVEVIPLEDLATRASTDMKARLAFLSYKNLMRTTS